MGFVLKTDVRTFKLAEPFDEAKRVSIDEDVVDGRIFEQRFDGTKASHFRNQFIGKFIKFFLVERDPFSTNIIDDIGLYVLAQLVRGHLVEKSQVEFIDDSTVELKLLVEQSWASSDKIAVKPINIALR